MSEERKNVTLSLKAPVIVASSLYTVCYPTSTLSLAHLTVQESGPRVIHYHACDFQVVNPQRPHLSPHLKLI